LRWGNASRFESSRPEILITAILRNRVYVRFRRLFRLSHRTCDPSSKWAVQRPGPAARRSNGPAVRRAAHAPPRSSPPMRRAAPTANFPAAGGRRPAGETRCVALDGFSFGPLVVGHRAACCHFQFQYSKLYQIVAPLENKGGEAVKYTKVVHFSRLNLHFEGLFRPSRSILVRRACASAPPNDSARQAARIACRMHGGCAAR